LSEKTVLFIRWRILEKSVLLIRVYLRYHKFELDSCHSILCIMRDLFTF
jgi:hypothetical protein